MNEVADTVDFIGSSPTRIAILAVLADRNGQTKRALRDRLEYSRTSVHRNLAALEDRGWIECDDGRYALTTGGAFVQERFFDLRETIETVSHLEPVLEWVERDDLDLDVTLLRDAEITVAEPGNPLAMVNRHVQRLKTTSTFTAMLPLTGLHPYEVEHRRMLAGEFEATHVVAPGVAETFQSDPDYAPLTEEMLDTGRYRLSVTETTVPFYLGVLDETVQIGVDDDGTPMALLESTSDEVREWAVDTLAAFERDARRIG